jgi:RND family efflux transporter MFP subunit
MMLVGTKHALKIAAGILCCLIIGSFVTYKVRAKSPVDKVLAAEGAPLAAVAIVKRGTVSNSFSVAGEFVPYQEVELHAKVSGYIRKINVDIGDRVKTGEILAVLEVPELNAQVVGADAGVQHSKQEILRLRSEVVRANADHESIHSAAERLQQVFKTQPGLIAQQELDDSLAKDRSTEAQVEAAKSALAAAEQGLAGSQANQVQVTAMQEYSRIVAPFNGVVIWRYADTGSLIQAGTSNSNSLPVVKVAQVNILRLRLPVPESLASHVRVGTIADIHVQATGEDFKGKVARLTDSFDRSTRTMQVEVDLPNSDNKLSPGMYADVTLLLDSRQNAIIVPVQALNHENDKTTVLLVNGENKVEIREIRTGLEQPDRAEVVGGLNAGDRVIIGNFSAYRAGQLVKPKVSTFEAGGGQ